MVYISVIYLIFIIIIVIDCYCTMYKYCPIRTVEPLIANLKGKLLLMSMATSKTS